MSDSHFAYLEKHWKVAACCFAAIILLILCYALVPGISRWRRLPEDVMSISMRDCLNLKVQKVILSYIDSAGPFPVEKWSASTKSTGTTQDIYYKGQLICKGNPDKSSYCIGLVFEVFMRANDDLALTSLKVGNGSQEDFARFRRKFYGATQRTFVDALVDAGLGIELKDFEQAKPGDLLQFWRVKTNGSVKSSGHCGIFQNWLRDGDNKISGFSLFQVGTETKGVGISQYYFGNNADFVQVDREKTYLVRAVIRK